MCPLQARASRRYLRKSLQQSVFDPRVITTAGRCAAKHTDDPDVAMNILAMKNFGSTHSNSRRCRAREPPIGQEDRCCATTRSVTIPAVQPLAIPEASPACLGRIAGFDVSQ